jgi:hypothetical protein
MSFYTMLEKFMKRILTVVATLFFLTILGSASASAQSFLGGGLALLSSGGTYVGLEARGVFNLRSVRNLAISPDFQYFFVKDFTLIGIDVTAHNHVAQFGRGGGAYGLAGLDIAIGSSGGESSTNLGINLGAGAMGDIGGVDAYGDLKLVVGNGTGVVISGGFLFELM